MATASNPRKPTFLWQGLLIMLPVVALAIAGLISLKQDERAAEQDAQKRAAENAQSFALAIRSSVNEQLQRFALLRNNWTAAMLTAGIPGDQNHYFNDQLKTNVEIWEHDYPGLKFADLAFPEAEILTNGTQIYPPEFPATPTPPQWFLELSSSQKILWENLRLAETPAEIETRRKAFDESKPANEAHFAAYNLFRPPEQRAAYTVLTTEAGVYFEDIACYQLLSATNARWTTELLHLVRDRTIDHPSFMSSRLYEMAGKLPPPAETELRQNLYWTEKWYDAESKTRTWLQPLRQLSRLTTNVWNPAETTIWAHWTGDADGKALAFFNTVYYSNPASNADMKITCFNGNGYRIIFLPRTLIETVFTRALELNKTFIPEYARATVNVEGQLLNSTNTASPNPEPPVLGSAAGQANYIGIAGGADFEVELFLISHKQMLAAEHRREMLFGALILGAMLAALIGFLAARRSFYRQWQLNELKSNFVSSVSHELRAPIASVRLMAENLELGKISTPVKQQEYFRFIVQECRRLSALIENVLDFSRIEQSRKQYEFEPTNVSALVSATVKLMVPYAAEKEVRLVLEMPGLESQMTHIEWPMDGRAMQQALVNLIDNAIKHSPKGEVVMVGVEIKNNNRAESSLNSQLRTLNLSVADHGPGIPTNEHAKIFERFYRRGSELRRETQGVGIGLSIVKHIVDAHGGKISVHSDVGNGSRFTIELPVKNSTTDGHR